MSKEAISFHFYTVQNLIESFSSFWGNWKVTKTFLVKMFKSQVSKSHIFLPCYVKVEKIWFRKTCPSRPVIVRLSLHMGFHITFSTMLNSKFISGYYAGCSVSVFAFLNPVLYILPSVVKITQSFSLLFLVLSGSWSHWYFNCSYFYYLNF